MSSEPIIRLTDVSVRFGRSYALEGLNLEVRTGEMIAVMGLTGAGKSTTLRVLVGQVRPSSGTIVLAGRDLARAWPSLKLLFGYVPDRDNHFEEFTGRGNLRFFAELYQVSRERVEECLQLLELTEVADRPVRGYSLGMRRKLLLVRALLHRPRLLFLDEPTANLDPQAAGLVCRLLRKLTDEGCTIVLATHHLLEATEFCDRIAVLRRGRLAALGTPDVLQAEPPCVAMS
jgi:ABC-2 type transport system ATP-binding protein